MIQFPPAVLSVPDLALNPVDDMSPLQSQGQLQLDVRGLVVTLQQQDRNSTAYTYLPNNYIIINEDISPALPVPSARARHSRGCPALSGCPAQIQMFKLDQYKLSNYTNTNSQIDKIPNF